MTGTAPSATTPGRNALTPPAAGEPIVAPRGLAGVIVTDTEIGDVRGQEGFFHYRQYSAIELAQRHSLEEVWHLMVEGRLPKPEEASTLRQAVGRARVVPAEVLEALPRLCPPGSAPLTVLRTAWSLLGTVLGLPALYDTSEEQRRDAALACAAAAPTLLAAAYRLGQGAEVIAPDPDAGHAEDYLRMVTGSSPGSRDVRAVERYLVATVDHGFNASTFTARTIASTGADLAACLVGALGSFSGPLHGGAPSRALEALDAIGDPANTADWVRQQVQQGRRIMGFGHAVYRTTDPRSEMLKQIALEYGGDLVDFAVQVEDTVVATLAELKPDRPLYANVEFFAGVVMELAGVPRSMFTPTFCVARSIGWVANVLEQARDPKIIRPLARYVGPPPQA